MGSPASSPRSIAVKTRGQQRGRGQIRVAGAVDGAILDPSRRRHAEHLRAVVVAVADVDRRPGGAAGGRADDQTLVRVDGRRGQRDVGLGVRLEPADEAVGELRQAEAARILGRVTLEQVDAVAPQADVEVAAVAGQMRERLRHERRDQPALLRQRLDHVAEEDRPVAGRQGV